MMPIQSRTYRKAFRWIEQDGVPVATVTDLNGRLWTMTCPVCGCLHELIGGEIGKPFKPDCLLRTLARMPAPRGNTGANWRRVLADWYAQYPEAAQHDTVLLLDAQQVAALDQAQRKAARRAKRGRPRKYEGLEKAA